MDSGSQLIKYNQNKVKSNDSNFAQKFTEKLQIVDDKKKPGTPNPHKRLQMDKDYGLM